jgi:large subunit ribosomal protein L25
MKHTLQAKKRDLKVKNTLYRGQGQILGNVYGEAGSQALVVDAKAVSKILPEVSESTVIYLTVDAGAEIPVMLSEVQKNPLTGEPQHLALRQVNLKHKVTAAIPIEAVGEFDVPEAVYLLVKDEVEAEALPTDLPEKFVVDVSKFTAVGEQITFADLEYDHDKVTLQIENDNEPIVVVDAVKEEVEEQPVVTEEAAPPSPTEGEAPAPSPAPAAETK